MYILVVLDPILHRYQPSKGDQQGAIWVGRFAPPGSLRVSSRGPFESDGSMSSGALSFGKPHLLLHMATLEQIFARIFELLGINQIAALVLTEPLANPPYCREELVEMLFGAFKVPRILIGVDCLLAAAASEDSSFTNGIVVNVGHEASHLIVVLEGRTVRAFRINWGSAGAASLLLRLLQLKYPAFPVKMQPWQAAELLQRAALVALDYEAQMRLLAQSSEALGEADFGVSFAPPSQPPPPAAAASSQSSAREREEALRERRREQGRRLRERLAEQRQAKLAAMEAAVEALRERKRALPEESVDEQQLCHRLEIAEEELEAFQVKLGIKAVAPSSSSTCTFDLLDIPDAELDAQGLKEKRKQRLLKSAAEARQRARQERLEAQERAAAQQASQEAHRLRDFDGWLSEQYRLRAGILARRRERARLRAALADRRSVESSRRLKQVMSLAQEDGPVPVDDDGFGREDSDWAIYRTITDGNNNGDDEGIKDTADDVEEEQRLEQIEADLERYDPEAFLDLLARESAQATTILDRLRNGPEYQRPLRDEDGKTAEQSFQLYVNVERYRVTEPLFDPPSLLGIDQAGLGELMEIVLGPGSPFKASEVSLLAANILVTGGWGAHLPGLLPRLLAEASRVAPAGTTVQVRPAPHGELAAWMGAARAAQTAPPEAWITTAKDESNSRRMWFQN